MDARTRLIEEAWVGDAVLTLYARLKILRDDGVLDGARCVRMTSNQFLGTMGEPTQLEAEIGRVYEKSGLEAAFAWIQTHLVPMFERQEANWLRRMGLPMKTAPSTKT